MPEFPTTDQRLAALDRSLTNITPSPQTVSSIELVRSVAKELGQVILEEGSPGREQSLALTHLEETVMWAVKGLVLRQPGVEANDTVG